MVFVYNSTAAYVRYAYTLAIACVACRLPYVRMTHTHTTHNTQANNDMVNGIDEYKMNGICEKR